MPRVIQSKNYMADKAWDALDIANMNGVTTRLHWTNKPYHWHINDGEEVFVILDGEVDMHYKEDSITCITNLRVGDIFYAEIGVEHVAHPKGEARILVVEYEGSL